MKKEIKIHSRFNSYKVVIGKKTFNKISTLANLKDKKSLNIIIVDRNVFRIYKNYIRNVIKNTNSKIIIFNSLERQKSIKGFNSLTKKIFELKPDRSSKLIIIGGGVLGDLGGFISSTILRGLKLILIPTTLLSQVDSSIGGKNGINNNFGKNLIGTFYQPYLVVIDTIFLKSLPRKQIISGYAEIIKHSLIKNKKNFIWLEKNFQNILNLREPFITRAILESIKIKSSIVSKDEKEILNNKNSRALLNFGHTFGHALEGMYNYNNITHGEAVSIGMVTAAKISFFLKYISKNKLDKIEKHLKFVGLPTSSDKIYSKKILNFIIHDKKNIKNLIKLVLLRDIGNAFISRGFTIKNLNKIIKNI